VILIVTMRYCTSYAEEATSRDGLLAQSSAALCKQRIAEDRAPVPPRKCCNFIIALTKKHQRTQAHETVQEIPPSLSFQRKVCSAARLVPYPAAICSAVRSPRGRAITVSLTALWLLYPFGPPFMNCSRRGGAELLFSVDRKC